jgi:hypothetical protein
LWDAYNAHRTELAHLLDSAYEDALFKKTDKAKIKHLIVEITSDLIAAYGEEDMKELHDKYSDLAFDAGQQEADMAAGEMMKSMLQGVFGMDLGDDADFSSPDKIEAALQEIHQREAENQRQAEERRAKRKKTAKQLEKEARRQQEEQNVGKSIQEVFRKLAAALHPDREPDLQERERKTAIMQRVNAAYAKKDLLQLLELQLEAEQIDQTHLNNIAEERLKYFNKILKEQLEELRQEIAEIEYPFKLQLHLSPYAPLPPRGLMQYLERDMQNLRHNISNIKRDIRTFQNSAALKAWLKGFKIPKKPGIDDLFFGDFEPPFGFK